MLFLGLYNKGFAEVSAPSLSEAQRVKIEELVAARIAARANKNFALSDQLRDQLLAMGVVLKDGKAADGSPVTDWDLKR